MTTASQTGQASQVPVTSTDTRSTSPPLYSTVLTSKPNKSHQIQRNETGNQQSHHEVPHTAVMKSDNPSSSYTPKPPYATDTENVHSGSGSKGAICMICIIFILTLSINNLYQLLLFVPSPNYHTTCSRIPANIKEFFNIKRESIYTRRRYKELSNTRLQQLGTLELISVAADTLLRHLPTLPVKLAVYMYLQIYTL